MPIYSPGVKPRDMHEHLHSSIGVGPKGDDGEKGDQGDPGFSPTVSTGDHVITITDVNGPHVYELPTYADEEAARAAAETARQEAEQARQAAETVRQGNESTRISFENQRKSNENTRKSNERDREFYETARQDSEERRVSKEISRQINERDRGRAEQARVDAEQQRVAADEARDQAEAQRAEDWETIKVEVDARGTAESARQQAEQERANNEVARQQAEAARNSAEQARRQAESSRDSAEQVRMQHEQDRSRAENARNIAESARSNAESERNSAWQTMSGNVDDAIAAANDAASDIREAAERGDFDGAPGETGPIGPAGADGFSPTVDVQAITGGHEVTITDADGAHSFEVLDGDPAEPGSITDAMLAPDGIKAQVAQLFGNQLMGTLSGTIDTVADAYAAPPLAVGVGGASTQVQTTGKNLLPDVLPDNTIHATMSSVISGAANARVFAVPCALNTDYIFSSNTNGTISHIGFGDRLPEVGDSVYDVSTMANRKTWSANSGEHPYILVNVTSVASFDLIPSREGQIEVGDSATAYEPYSGGYASPSPNWPQPILSADSITLHASADGTTDYTNWPVSDLSDGHPLRSLPDGTKDTLNLAYLRPSTREGWAWYSREVVKYVGHVEDMSELTWGYSSDYVMFSPTLAGIRPSTAEQVSLMCTGYAGFGNRAINYLANHLPDKHVSLRANYGTLWLRDTDYTDATLFTAAVAGMELDYPLATPVTTTLDPIELPELPAPTCTVWCDGGSATPTFQMQYVQDTNLVIADLRAELADLATS